MFFQTQTDANQPTPSNGITWTLTGSSGKLPQFCFWYWATWRHFRWSKRVVSRTEIRSPVVKEYYLSSSLADFLALGCGSAWKKWPPDIWRCVFIRDFHQKKEQVFQGVFLKDPPKKKSERKRWCQDVMFSFWRTTTFSCIEFSGNKSNSLVVRNLFWGVVSYYQL